ncbi:MAG: hypothetical protein ABW005_14950 [Burkholderiaceae bacterium]
MKFSPLKILRATALAALAALLVAAALAIQTGPRLAPAAPTSAADVLRAREFLRANDPRRGEPGQPRRLEIGERELNLLLAHLALRRPDTLVELRLQPGLALLSASAALPGAGGFGWLNVDARLRETASLPAIDSLRIGRLPVPAWLAEAVLRRALQRWQAHGELQLAGELVQHIGFDAQRLRLNYRWQADSLERALAALWPLDEQRRMQAYEARLGALGAAHAQDESISLAALLPPMFALARERTAQGQPAAAENRAALLTLALHVNGRRWGSVMPAARDWPAPRPLLLTLAGREDFPMHLLVSAALALEGGGPLADAIGIDKELADTRGGSGFSFNDIAADRAGTRLGLLARKDPERLQRALVPGLAERDFMPAVDDLPEFMSEQAFLERYGGVGAPAYREMMAMIEARLDSIALLR